MFFQHFRIPTWTKNGPKMGPQINPKPLVEIIIAKKIYHATPLFASKIDPGAQADFWTDLGRLLVALGSLLALFGPFWYLWAPSWLLLALFGSLLAAFSFPFATFSQQCFFLVQLSLHFALSQTFECQTSSKILFFLAPQAATHTRSICFRLLLVSKTIFGRNLNLFENFLHAPADNRRNPHLQEPSSATTCGTLP